MKRKICIHTTAFFIVATIVSMMIGCNDRNNTQQTQDFDIQTEIERQDDESENQFMKNLSHIKEMAKVEETLELYWNYLKIEEDPKRAKELREVLKYYGQKGGFVVNGQPLRELVKDLE